MIFDKITINTSKIEYIAKKSFMKEIQIIVIFLLNGLMIFAQSKITIQDGYIELNEEGVEYYEEFLPSAVDFTESEYLPPVYLQTDWVCNQVACSYYMMTFETNKRKDLNSSLMENQYSVYFPWNFGNGGTGWYGDNYIISMEMMKQLGVPILGECESDIQRDSSIWISGYEQYYNLMHNRIDEYYKISTNTINGLTTLKSWVYDNCGSEYFGGTATFLANIATGGATDFDSGTPHEGEYVITKCGDDALHARTIVGYDDNVCFDYNDDGEYTNDIDLNGDGQIDVRDYEKGGFKLAESFGPSWQGSGYCWMMYKCFADAYPEGGILNNYVHVLEPKIDYEPLLTAKIRLKHTSRQAIKVKVGISADIDSETWEYVRDFSIFNFQGGNFYMQGSTSEADKTIEFGLDITHLLEYFNNDKEAKIFLIVTEADPSGNYEGEIQEFTVIDYSGSVSQEYTYNTITDLNNDSETVVNVNVTLDSHDIPIISTESLPVLTSESSIWYPLEYSGGTPPYKWELLPVVDYMYSTESFDEFEGTKLTPDEDFDGVVDIDLPFNFPFGKQETDAIRVHTNGYILPFSTTNVWTQFREHLYPFFINEKVIAPLARYSLINDFETGDGMWYEIEEDTIRIRWQGSDRYSEPWTSSNFACELSADGTIKFKYGNENLKSIFSNIGGISFGNQSDNTMIWMDEIPSPNTCITISTTSVPTGLYINQSGVLYGETGVVNNYPFRVKLTDANGISNVVQYELTTKIENQIVDYNVLSIYPNPVESNIIVDLSKFDYENAVIYVFNGTGKKVYNDIISNSKLYSLNLSQFKDGIYYIEIKINDQLYHHKIVKI